MATWTTEQVEERIVEILGDVPEGVERHHFGRPYLTAYQLAIELDRRYPRIRTSLSLPLGGANTGAHNSLAQYVALQLSQRIKADPKYPVEGRMLSNIDVVAIDYRSAAGDPIRSSLTGSGYDLSMYRLREA